MKVLFMELIQKNTILVSQSLAHINVCFMIYNTSISNNLCEITVDANTLLFIICLLIYKVVSFIAPELIRPWIYQY